MKPPWVTLMLRPPSRVRATGLALYANLEHAGSQGLRFSAALNKRGTGADLRAGSVCTGLWICRPHRRSAFYPRALNSNIQGSAVAFPQSRTFVLRGIIA